MKVIEQKRYCYPRKSWTPNLGQFFPFQTVSAESFNDGEYEELLSKYSDGGAYSSHGQAVENQRHVQNVKEKINSMKKKFQVSGFKSVSYITAQENRFLLSIRSWI